MPDSTAEHIDRIERGLDALFATEVAKEVLAAVDFEAILAEAPAADPVDVERLAEALGRPIGRALAHYVVGGSGTSGVAKRAIGSAVGQRAAATGVRLAVEHVDTDRVAETLVELDEETVPGPTLSRAIPVDVADSDVLDFDPTSPAADSTSPADGPVGIDVDAAPEGRTDAGSAASQPATDGVESGSDAGTEN